MKFTAIHLPMIWLVLHAVPTLVLGGSLRGLSTSLSVESNALPSPPPPADLTEDISLAAGLDCERTGKGQAEIWLGFHEVDNLNQATIWVISPFWKHHTSFPGGGEWLDVDNKDLLPFDPVYKKKCYKYFSIGAGTPSTGPQVLAAGINRDEDVTTKLDNPSLVARRNTVRTLDLTAKIDTLIKNINSNFAAVNPNDTPNTILRYNPLPHTDWYTLGHGWGQFNSNGIMAGLLNYLEYDKKKKLEVSEEGWAKPVPTKFFTEAFTTVEDMKMAVYETQTCVEYPAELWVGFHTIKSVEENVPIDHAELWAIQSTSSTTLPDEWMELSPELIPFEYGGDRNCAKFFALSSGFEHGEYKGMVNNEDDCTTNLLGAKKFTVDLPNDLLAEITRTNVNIVKNFEVLKSTTTFPQDWNQWGIRWRQFNGNGYVSGFLNYLAYLKTGDFGEETGKRDFMPDGTLLDGWDKDIPIEFFWKTYTTVNQMRDVAFGDHPKTVAESVVMESQDFFESEELSSLDP